MKLRELKSILNTIPTINFKLENGETIPPHFHLTEIGLLTRDFIDCGGVLRNEKSVNFQLWEADDYDHRLISEKFLKIIHLAENTLAIDDELEIEVEYQQKTIGKYSLDFSDGTFILKATKTACLALENCGIPSEKTKVNLREITPQNACCEPNSKCC